jgi:hypothetical protein
LIVTGRALLCCLILLSAAIASAQADSERTISPIGGDVYRATDGRRTTVFMATPDGILVADPLNLDFARWLRQQLALRFPAVPVRYVVYTSADHDRIGGATVFGSAQVISTPAIQAAIAQRRLVLPSAVLSMDRNANGRLERDELVTPPGSELLAHDFDADGILTAAELWSDTSTPDGSVSDKRTIVMSGVPIHLLRGVMADGRDLIAIEFPAAHTVFAPAFQDDRPFATNGARPAELGRWLETLSNRYFDTLTTGDGRELPKAAISAVSSYVSAMVSSVAAGYDAAETLTQVKQRAAHDLPTASSSARDADAEFVYRRIGVWRVDVSGGVSLNRLPGEGQCGQDLTCRADRQVVLGGTIAAGVTFNQIRAAVELTPRQRVTTEFAYRPVPQFFLVDNISNRERLLSTLIGFETRRADQLNLAILGGFTFIHTATRYMTTTSNSSVVDTGSYEGQRAGFTAGADLKVAISRSMTLLVPVRYTALRKTIDEPDRRTDLRAGISLGVPLRRLVR